MKEKPTLQNPGHNQAKPNNEFTQTVIQKARKRQTYKDFLFMIALGFKNILGGFLKPKTVKHLQRNQTQRKTK